MDHWGDPWADDAATDTKVPPREHIEVNTPAPTLSTAPVLLNAFLDDAQWGNDENSDEDFGGWTSSGKQKHNVDWAAAQPRVHHAEATSPAADAPDPNVNINAPKPTRFDWGDEGWGNTQDAVDTSRELDIVVSEASDSATTVQADDLSQNISTDLTDSSHPDDDLSTRPSTSPSDVSHTEAHTDSPRTSYEDERMVERPVESEKLWLRSRRRGTLAPSQMSLLSSMAQHS